MIRLVRACVMGILFSGHAWAEDKSDGHAQKDAGKHIGQIMDVCGEAFVHTSTNGAVFLDMGTGLPEQPFLSGYLQRIETKGVGDADWL